ncbi:MAG: peptidylprolyl isomerase [Prevotella sp.]|jgi:peptidyl-prolyl cis-trans isomerase SurA|nr:peptidylprolyl isomerase [Prevotella sp.]
MNKKLLIILFSLLTTSGILAQTSDPIAFTLNGVPVYKYEVEYAYKKANENLDNKISLKDFMPSYIEFKRNVEEAKAQQLDTLPRYKREFMSYRYQIATPYMSDTVYENEYIRKMYDRLLENIEINHIIFPFKTNIIFPKDTVATYNEAIRVRELILKNGFTDEVIKSIDTEVPAHILGLQRHNGYLGWVTAFILPPALENAIYNMPIGEISLPIRTADGYHIVQVLNKRAAVGSAEIEQVMFRFGHIPATQHQIDSVKKVAFKEYNTLHSTDDYQALCEQFSIAYKTGDKGCYFGIVGLDSKLSPEFLTATFNLEKPGDISQPVKTDYGYHIIRLLNRIPVPDYETMKGQLRAKIEEGNRRYDLSKAGREELRSKVNLKISRNEYSKFNDIAHTISPKDSLFLVGISNTDATLLEIDGKRYVPVKEFIRYIEYRQRILKGQDPDELQMLTVIDPSPYSLSTDILGEYFSSFITIIINDYLDDTLDERYQDFKEIMNEFSDGLLVFEVKDKNIWQRSKTDGKGLEKYFQKNKRKYKLEAPQYKGVIIHAKNDDALKKAQALVNKEKKIENLVNEIRADINKDTILVKLEPGIWSKGQNPYIDYEIYEGNKPSVDKTYPYFSIQGSIISKPEEFSDVKALVELDYQNELEKEWNAYLKRKYKVKINESVLKTIK